jgi:hypothetical protein
MNSRIRDTKNLHTHAYAKRVDSIPSIAGVRQQPRELSTFYFRLTKKTYSQSFLARKPTPGRHSSRFIPHFCEYLVIFPIIFHPKFVPENYFLTTPVLENLYS